MRVIFRLIWNNIWISGLLRSFSKSVLVKTKYVRKIYVGLQGKSRILKIV
jgi:hypothetical protein